MVRLSTIGSFLLLFFCSLTCVAQQVSLGGYVGGLYVPVFSLDGRGAFENNGLLHNRLNFRYDFAPRWSFTAEGRNRLFVGSMAGSITTDNGLMNLSVDWMGDRNFKFNSQLDRLNVAYQGEKFSAVVGRQRINWSQTLLFNPNDIFNGYSLFDYDYPERNGSDAIRLSYYTSEVSVIEAAVKLNRWGEVTAALLRRFNSYGSDFQFLAGIINSRDLTLGAGFSGEIRGVNIRGELSDFYDLKNRQNTLVAAVGADYVFSNTLSLAFELLYNTQHADENTPIFSLYQAPLTPSRLSITRFTAVGRLQYPISPILNCGFTVMSFMDLPLFYLGPSIDYSLSNSFTLSAMLQTFISGASITPSSMGMGYVRVRYDF